MFDGNTRGLARFWADDDGAELVEWMLVTLAVGLVGYALLVAVRDQVIRVFEHVLDGFFS